MHNFTDRQYAEIVRRLERVKKYATLETAEFSRIGVDRETAKYPVKESEVTDFIRERVRIYHDSWIIGAIDILLEDLASPARLTEIAGY